MKRFLFLLMAAGIISVAHAAISVGPAGSGTLTFNTTPLATEFSTAVLNGSGTTYTTAEALDTGANTLEASSIVRTLPTSSTLPPSTFSGGFRHNNNAAGLWLQSRPTTDGTNAANVLLATLQNDSGDAISSITISYTFGINNPATEEAPGFRVFYSLSGAAGTWQLIPELSANDIPGTHSTTVSIGSWPAASTMYLLWVDDNAGSTDPSYTIDEFSVTPGNVILPLSVVLTTPTNGTLFAAPADVIVRANSSGTTPATSISFYTNDVLFATDDAAPYSNQLVNLPAGTYSIYAVALNGIETAYSTTNTITVRPEFVSYSGGTYVETFDSLTEAGTTTPVGWYVGGNLPATTLQITPGDGSAGASGAILGWNYGSVGDSDRALGTAPTGADRNIVLRILNNTSSNITGINLVFDGEVWRNYTNLNGSLTNYISVDEGATWVPTTFDFAQPFEPAQPQGAVNGNDPANRIANIGGGFDLPAPVVPGGALYIRWHDFNEGGTDGGLAIDNVQFDAFFEPFSPFVSITSPSDGETFAEASPITITAIAAMANPVTNVTFFRDGGQVIGSDSTAPYSVVYSNSVAGVHTLTATAQDSLGNSISTTNLITIVVSPNILPTITITNPPDSSFVVGANITNGVVVADADGTIAAVEYYVDGVLAYRDTTNPTKFEYGDALAGTHTITAVAIDNAGGRGSNSVTFSIVNPPGATFLVSNGATWRYLDDTTDPGATWTQAGFDDSGWSNGIAEFGFGDSAQDRPERTVVRRIVGGTTNVTFYFRRQFTVENLAAITDLVLKLQADDGAVVYINGTEVYRTTNMPAGPVTHTTFTTDTAPDDGAGYTTVSIPASVLVAGPNIVAVEIHQDNLGSSDISFDLMLYNQGTVGPALGITRISDTQAEIFWPDSFVGYRLEYKTDLNQAVWIPEAAVPTQSGGYYRVVVNTSTGMKFWRLTSP